MSARFPSKRRMLISCPIFRREIDEYLARSSDDMHVTYLPIGLHGDTGQDALAAIQQAVDEIDESYDAIIIGYGVCNHGIDGLIARHAPLVLPRTHDCISLLFGCHKRYREYFSSQPDTYFLTSGWIDQLVSTENAPAEITASPSSIKSQFGIEYDLAELIKKYGEDNGRYIYDQLKPRKYARQVYISSGCDGESALIEQAQQNANEQGCPLEVVEGNTELLEALLHGPWDDERFLVTPPGQKVVVTHGEQLIEGISCHCES